MHFVPVHILLREETVVLVDDFPKLLEIAARIVGKLLHIVAPANQRNDEEGGYNGCDESADFHNLLIFMSG